MAAKEGWRSTKDGMGGPADSTRRKESHDGSSASSIGEGPHRTGLIKIGRALMREVASSGRGFCRGAMLGKGIGQPHERELGQKNVRRVSCCRKIFSQKK